MSDGHTFVLTMWGNASTSCMEKLVYEWNSQLELWNGEGGCHD